MLDFTNKWKFLSISLMVVLALGFVAPHAYADTLSTIMSTLENMQLVTNSTNSMVQNIQNNQLPAISSGIDGAKSNLKNIQNSVNSIKETIPADPASNSHVDNSIARAQYAINAYTDGAIASQCNLACQDRQISIPPTAIGATSSMGLLQILPRESGLLSYQCCGEVTFGATLDLNVTGLNTDVVNIECKQPDGETSLIPLASGRNVQDIHCTGIDIIDSTKSENVTVQGTVAYNVD